MKHDFEERRQNRLLYAQEQVAKNESKSGAFTKNANRIASFIPPGQPILTGHHSEKRHRSDLNKMDIAMEHAIQADDKAAYYTDKAKSIEKNRAIFSDDPEAFEKLEKKIQELEALQEFMKAANKCVKKKDKEGFLKLPNATEELWIRLNTPDFLRRLGYPDYELRNNNQNISRLKKRHEALRREAERETTETTINGVRYVENVEANRVQLLFSNIPAEEIRQQLKQLGFRWCPSEGAWQRHLNNSGIYCAKRFLESYSESHTGNGPELLTDKL